MRALSDWSPLPRTRTRYADPANRYISGFAPPWRRAVAAVVDWGLCYIGFLIASIPLGVVQSLGAISNEEGDLGGTPGRLLVVGAQLLTLTPVLAYFVVLLPTSQTFGMRLSDIHAVSMSTGRGPSYPVAAVRGAVATVVAAAFYIVFLDSTSYDKGERLDSTSMLVLDASYVLAAVGFVSALLMIVSPTRRSLFDRLFRSAVLDELEAVNPRVGPWGPLDTFDVSNRPQRSP